MKDVLRLKLELFERGVAVSPAARDQLTSGGSRLLNFVDYATTGGLTLRIGSDYVNAPVDDWFCDAPAAEIGLDGEDHVLTWRGESFPVEILPLPGYLGSKGTDSVMTHADRARLSPVAGCSCSCEFCDSPRYPYRLRPLGDLLNALDAAIHDDILPARHVLLSGGTPRPSDVDRFDRLLAELVRECPVEADVMLMPQAADGVIGELADAGVHGLSINLELFDELLADKLTPQKSSRGRERYAAAWTRGVDRLGTGRVRSLLVVGLESEESTLRGVEFIASHGVDPVLSPFRPAARTSLASVRPPSADMMERLHLKSREIARRYGVRLGPRCVPCQHNVIATADDEAN